MTRGKLTIPLIDISGFESGNAAARDAIAAAVGAASEQYGFMRLTGHGVPAQTVADMFSQGTTFFANPETEKLAIRDQAANRGYVPMYDQVYPGEKPAGQESFSMGHPTPPTDEALGELPFYKPTPWPDLPGFHETMHDTYEAMFAVGETILSAMALHLGREPDFFVSALQNSYSNMRIIHYPEPGDIVDVTDFGSRPHEDRGLITLLIQDGNGGLDVEGPDGEWIAVEPDQASIICNVGRLLRRWTNNRYVSAIHRVVNRAGTSRQSIPLFVHPGFDQVVDAADFAAPGDKVKFEPVVAGPFTYEDFAMQRPSWKTQLAE
ncbi:MAG: 2-oxoglutarate and iron-dependent oxygenase domain-containing protein [Alphaproteobacteria bacterium]